MVSFILIELLDINHTYIDIYRMAQSSSDANVQAYSSEIYLLPI